LIENIEHELKKSKYTYQKILNYAFQGKLTKQLANEESTKKLLEQAKKEKEEYVKQQIEINKNRTKIKIMEKEKLTITQILEQAKNPVLAEELWLGSIYTNNIDEFYAELKILIENGTIEELPRKGKKSYLKLIHYENR
jgi:hypothetical protein